MQFFEVPFRQYKGIAGQINPNISSNKHKATLSNFRKQVSMAHSIERRLIAIWFLGKIGLASDEKMLRKMYRSEKDPAIKKAALTAANEIAEAYENDKYGLLREK